MTSRFKQYASATAVLAGLACASLPAGAGVFGDAGEALLVPLAVWSGGSFNDPDCRDGFPPACNPFEGYTPAVDTVIEVFVPGSIGQDAIPNIYTAEHSTPTNTPTALTPSDPDLFPGAGGYIPQIHWFWFNQRSQEIDSGTITVSPDDVVQISITEIANGQNENVPGYFVLVDENATNGDAATFSMFGNAWLTGAIHFFPPNGGPPGPNPFNGIGFPLIGASIPVLPMADGEDGPFVGGVPPVPTNQDQVKYRLGTPYAVSPTIAGFRTNRSDGLPDGFVFDLALSNRLVPTIHVIWFDHNLDGGGGQFGYTIEDLYPASNALVTDQAAVHVFDLDELDCNTGLRLPNELNVLWIPPAFETDLDDLWVWNEPFQWTTDADLLCVVSDQNPAALFTTGFVQYRMTEYIDSDVGRPESAAYAFSIKVDGGLVSNDADPAPEAVYVLLESSLGHFRGTFKSF